MAQHASVLREAIDFLEQTLARPEMALANKPGLALAIKMLKWYHNRHFSSRPYPIDQPKSE